MRAANNDKFSGEDIDPEGVKWELQDSPIFALGN